MSASGGRDVPVQWESWRPRGGSANWQVRELLRALIALHSTFSEEIWLWRGQSHWGFDTLEPGMHSRLRKTPGLAMDERNVLWATREFMEIARTNGLDQVEGLRLPDLALLAHLQHHGAATPLLDVTVDPLVGLWMVAHASGSDPTSGDDEDGALFGIRRPPEDRWLSPLESRPYWSETSGDIASALSEGVHWFQAPDISERLRIQRGSFLVGPLADDGKVTFPLSWYSWRGSGWLSSRIAALGQPGRPRQPGTEVVVFRVGRGIKNPLRTWLQERAGLTQEVIYPTPWHRPFLEQFCRAYGRARPIDFRQ